MNAITDFIFNNLESIWSMITATWVLSSFVLVALLCLVVNLVRQTINKD